MKDVSVCFWCWPSQAKEDPLAVLFGWLLLTNDPNGSYWKSASFVPAPSVVVMVSPWTFGNEKVCTALPVAPGRRVRRTLPGRLRYFSTTAVPAASSKRSGVSVGPVKA